MDNQLDRRARDERVETYGRIAFPANPREKNEAKSANRRTDRTNKVGDSTTYHFVPPGNAASVSKDEGYERRRGWGRLG